MRVINLTDEVIDRSDEMSDVVKQNVGGLQTAHVVEVIDKQQFESIPSHPEADETDDAPWWMRGGGGQAGAARGPATAGGQPRPTTIQEPEHAGARAGHTGRAHACAACGKRFKLRTSYNRHLRLHTGTKPYACATCDAAFVRSDHLKAHRRTHTDERPYSCATCKKRFSCWTTLNRHRRSHAGVKRYSCSTCNKPFIRLPSLVRHERSHADDRPYNYACHMCTIKFAALSSLQNHLRRHREGDRVLECKICGRRFEESSSLEEHEETHKIEKAYSCGICYEGFDCLNDFQNHARIHM
ncbi:oocyte zinc finger protein XlCOF19-like [Cydia amplana]|uniref:oocyte zinc finger protein XlCOF19-like n=1 Tax=Cydia amplana TaxID=1869771 RepID=UPI002FE6ABC5